MASNILPGHGSGHRDESTPLLPQISSHIAHEGESGRSGFHPRHFLAPFVPIAITLQFFPSLHLWKFATAYIAVIPTANLLSFAGQEFARKLPKVAGILIETTFGSIIEIILFIVLLSKHEVNSPDDNGDEGNLIPIIQAAILGSILTNLLLCLSLCFFVGGLKQASQKFHAIVSEVGTRLLLVAAFGLLIPSAFYSALKAEVVPDFPGFRVLHEKFTEASSQHSIFDEVIEMDEHRDADREADMEKPKFTMTEAIVAILIALAFVTALLIFLVEKIEHVVESGVPDQFLGLILLPFVEKAAEHLTAIDEAYDGVINVALYHCLGPSIQTALFNGPLVVLVGWAIGKPMDLNFEIFMIVLLVLSILVVGNFLRDGKSNWLEGALLVVIYAIIAIACWYYPNPDVATSNGIEGSEMVNVTMSVDTLRQLQKLISA
ncbi:Ca2+:H+ antiporter [Fusarium circinatum]|uniref:Ca2+:H+ antiporter n=1 Tax=Fusarium circinatum TaxID=48490 RepID=A0A8H5WTG0_FUSCI|nr:Ca2+:H+ antiporter [Fusarium circinatum]